MADRMERTGFSHFLLIAAVLLLDCFPVLLSAQSVEDTSLLIPTIEVQAPRIQYQSFGSSSDRWALDSNSLFRADQLSDLVQQKGGIFVKSYGIGSLATASIRGGTAGHTALNWNGLPLNSAALGLSDLALVPLSLVDQVDLQKGGSSALWGSGAIGGTLSLRNTAPAAGWRLGLRESWGSFGRQGHHLSLAHGGKRFSFRSRIFRQQARNDFPFRIRADQPEQRLTHANWQQEGFMQEWYWQPHPKHQINVHAWWQQTERELPPTTTQTRSEATQKDDALRLALHWQFQGARSRWQSRTAYFMEDILYENPLQSLVAPTQFRTFIQEVEHQMPLTRHLTWQAGLHFMAPQATATGYPAGIRQDRLALFTSLRWYATDRWRLQLAGRQEWVQNIATRPVPSLGIDFQATDQLAIKAKVSRNYRVPTLNDLYWQPGGNPNLLPEEGWSQELGFHLASKATSPPWHIHATVFNRSIQHWILWSQPPDQPFWSANNISRVWSRGLEFAANYHRRTGRIRHQLAASYQWVKSTNQSAITRPDIPKGTQLWYVPVQQAQLSWEGRYKTVFLSYTHQYTGATLGVNEDLDSYFLGHAGLGYRHSGSSWGSSLSFRLQNCWNTHYRVIERRPMPGRHFAIHLTIYGERSPQK